MKNIDPGLEISNVGSSADIDSIVIRDQLKKLANINPAVIRV